MSRVKMLLVEDDASLAELLAYHFKREDFDVVREMASKARTENERLAARVAELEARLGAAAEAAGPEASSAAPAKPGREPTGGADGTSP